jgi:SAM-dependent methyltransferase
LGVVNVDPTVPGKVITSAPAARLYHEARAALVRAARRAGIDLRQRRVRVGKRGLQTSPSPLLPQTDGNAAFSEANKIGDGMADTSTHSDHVATSFDAEWAAKYREMDEQALSPGRSGDHYCRILSQISTSFGRQIDALDVGCGTGRFFHCLKRVGRLVGVDISAAMLAYAKHPVKSEHIDANTIDLMCGDVLSVDLPLAGFDLIYSIGALAEYSPLDERTVRRLRDLLAPQGLLFITAVDSRSRVSVPESKAPSFARRLARKAFPLLPHALRRTLNRRLSPFYLSRRQVESVFLAAGFADVTLTEFVHTTGWRGTHWDCVAR